MAERDPGWVGAVCGAVGYVFVVCAFVAAAHLGWIPGTEEPHTSLLGPYRLTVALFSVGMAALLGVGSASFGALLGRWWLGLGILFVGGVATGTALLFAPWILYPNDRYSPAFVWLLLGGPTGFLAWAACAVRAAARTGRANEGAPS